MKKLGIVLLLLASTSAFAFGGGGGGGRTRRFYERHGGVDAIGVHVHGGDQQPDILICNPCEDPVDNQCVPRTCDNNQHCDTEQDACVCDEGFEKVNDGCLAICPEGWTRDPSGECINPCESASYDTDCQTCTPVDGQPDIQNQDGTCGADGNNLCVEGVCKDPCSIGEHPTDVCTPSWHPENGECKPDYATTCGDNMICDQDHICICPAPYFWNGTSCLAPCDTNYFHISTGTCTSCTVTSRVETTIAECERCGNKRKLVPIGDTTYCATTDCGLTKFQDIYGVCHACTISNTYKVESEAACTTACPTRHTVIQSDHSISCVKGCAAGYEEVDGQCLPACPSGLERNTDNTCTICTNGNVYLSYMNDPCGTGTPMNETTQDCVCTSSQGKCMSYTATGPYGATDWQAICPNPDATPCTSNKDCTSTQYCNVATSSMYFAIPDTGTCMELDGFDTYTYNSKTFILSYSHFNFWAAENWCKAHKKTLVKLSTLGIDKNNLGSYFEEHGFCRSNGEEKCENVDWTPLYQVFGNIGEFFYTSDPYGSDFARDVDISYSSVSYIPRSDFDLALCE